MTRRATALGETVAPCARCAWSHACQAQALACRPFADWVLFGRFNPKARRLPRRKTFHQVMHDRSTPI